MSTLRQIFTRQFQIADVKNAFSNLGFLRKWNALEIGRPVGAVLVLAAVLIGLLVTYWLAGSSLSALQSNYNARQDLVDTLRKRRISTGIALHRAGAGHADPFLSAPTETLAASALDDNIRRIANASNGTVVSSHPVVDHDSQSPGNRIEIKAVIDGKIDALQTLLFQLETGTPLVFVDELSLEVRSDSIDGSGAGTNPNVHMAATFVAYWKSATQNGATRR
jgi:general secretion pathway protein M